MNISLNYWNSRTGLERIYINAGEETLGFFEVRTRELQRGGSYYDRHRAAKGDTTRTETSPIAWHGQDGVASLVLDAVFGDRKVGLAKDWREAREVDQWSLFNGLKLNARGFRHACTKTTKRDQPIREANEARQHLSFEIDR